MNPENLPIGITLKSAKTDDVKNLMVKHFGPGWRNMDRLRFLNDVIPVNLKDKQKPEIDEEDDLTDCDCECGFNEETDTFV